MADKGKLRKLRAETIINATSKEQEKDVIKALETVLEKLMKEYKVSFEHKKQLRLCTIVQQLRKNFPDVEFFCHSERTYISPDGGILYLKSLEGELFPILIVEVKNQGTNDLRKEEGKDEQSKGNAIERLGKNVIAIRALMKKEQIIPFLCFGYGCDFRESSTILDRVSTIAIFGRLNETYLHALGEDSAFDRGSFYFREKKWKVDEMVEIMYDIAERSIQHYFSKYKKTSFLITK